MLNACSLAIIMGLVMARPFFPFRYCLGGHHFYQIFSSLYSIHAQWEYQMTALRHTLAMPYVYSGWRVDELAPVTLWKRIEFPLWIVDFVRLSCPRLALLWWLPDILHQTKGLISGGWWLPLGCCHLRPWLWVWQRSVRGSLLLGCLQWPLPSTDRGTFPNRP